MYILYIYAKKYGELRGSTEIVVFKTLNDTLNIFKEIKLFGNSKDFVNRYYKFLDKYFKISRPRQLYTGEVLKDYDNHNK